MDRTRKWLKVNNETRQGHQVNRTKIQRTPHLAQYPTGLHATEEPVHKLNRLKTALGPSPPKPAAQQAVVGLYFSLLPLFLPHAHRIS